MLYMYIEDCPLYGRVDSDNLDMKNYGHLSSFQWSHATTHFCVGQIVTSTPGKQAT